MVTETARKGNGSYLSGQKMWEKETQEIKAGINDATK